MAPSRVCAQFQRSSSNIRSSGTSRKTQSSHGLIRETRRPVDGSLGIAQSIPDESPNIELVAQNTRPAERMPTDRRVAPWAAARTRCALSVEFGRDPARALARGEVRKDATNHRCLGLDDLAATALAVLDDG